MEISQYNCLVTAKVVPTCLLCIVLSAYESKIIWYKIERIDGIFCCTKHPLCLQELESRKFIIWENSKVFGRVKCYETATKGLALVEVGRSNLTKANFSIPGGHRSFARLLTSGPRD